MRRRFANWERVQPCSRLFGGHLVLGRLGVAVVPYLLRQRAAVAVLPGGHGVT